MIKALYEKHTAIIILNGEGPELNPQKSQVNQKCPLFLFYFNTVLKVLAIAMSQEEKIKLIQIKKANYSIST